MQTFLVMFFPILLGKFYALGFWGFETSQASRGILFNYISNGLVFYLCVLKGRPITLGRKKEEGVQLWTTLFPLRNWPELSYWAGRENDMQEYCGWFKNKNKNKKQLSA